MAEMKKDLSKMDLNLVGESNLVDVNNYVQNQFDINISNFPNFTNVKNIDLSQVFSNVKSISLPEVAMKINRTYYTHYNRIEPVTNGYRDLSAMSLKLQADSSLLNWHLIQSLVFNTRAGIGIKGNNFVHDNCIEELTINLKDNLGVVKSHLIYTNVFITTISDLELSYGTAENYFFVITLEYEKCDYKLEDNS